MLVNFRQPYKNVANWPFYKNNYDRLLDELFNIDNSSLRSSSAILRGDLVDEGDNLLLVAEIPGIKKENVKITFFENTLTISGERDAFQLPEGAQWLKNERITGKFSRSFKLPSDIDSSKVTAEYKDGLILVSLIKSEKAKPKEIKIL
jgi:HSP20 family protein